MSEENERVITRKQSRTSLECGAADIFTPKSPELGTIMCVSPEDRSFDPFDHSAGFHPELRIS